MVADFLRSLNGSEYFKNVDLEKTEGGEMVKGVRLVNFELQRRHDGAGGPKSEECDRGVGADERRREGQETAKTAEADSRNNPRSRRPEPEGMMALEFNFDIDAQVERLAKVPKTVRLAVVSGFLVALTVAYWHFFYQPIQAERHELVLRAPRSCSAK